jgi:mono/diheme cytochrome c family protein
MPAWKDRLTEGQQRDVLAYLRSLVHFYKPGTPAPLPADQAN